MVMYIVCKKQLHLYFYRPNKIVPFKNVYLSSFILKVCLSSFIGSYRHFGVFKPFYLKVNLNLFIRRQFIFRKTVHSSLQLKD